MRESRAHLQPLRQHFSSCRAQATYSRMPRVPGGSSMDIHRLTYWQVNVMSRRRVEEDSLLQHRLSLLCSHRAAGRGTCAASAACTAQTAAIRQAAHHKYSGRVQRRVLLVEYGRSSSSCVGRWHFSTFSSVFSERINRLQKVQKFARGNTACWRLRDSFFGHDCQLVTQ